MTNSPSDYFRKFSLERDPFPPARDDIVYLTPALQERLKRISQIITEGNRLIVVTAPPGAGTSTLAEQLGRQAEKNWRIGLVRAEAGMDKEALAFQLIRQVLPDKADKPAMAIPMLHKYLELSERSGFIPVFIIDEADRLPPDTLKFVLELVALRYAEAMFRVILFAEEPLTDRLNEAASGIIATSTIIPLDLPTLSKQQVREYIDTRLKAAGEGVDIPFDDDTLDRIHRISGGLPGNINTAAREILQGSGSTEPEPAKDDAGRQRYSKIAAVIILAAIAGFAAMKYLSSDISAPPARDSVATVDPAGEPPAETIAETEPVDESLPEPEPGTVLAETEDTSSEDSLVDTVVETPAPPDVEIQTTDIPEPPQMIAASDNIAPEPVPGPPAVAVAEPAVAPAPPVEPPPAPARPYTIDEANIYNLDAVPPLLAGIRGNGWYRSQPRNAYVLQLISASDINNVIELVEQNPGVKPELSGYVKYTPSGRPRYLMFYGLYRDKDEAAAAVAGLPAGLKATQPWPRSIGNITDEIDTVIAPPR